MEFCTPFAQFELLCRLMKIKDIMFQKLKIFSMEFLKLLVLKQPREEKPGPLESSANLAWSKKQQESYSFALLCSTYKSFIQMILNLNVNCYEKALILGYFTKKQVLYLWKILEKHDLFHL
jgi:hypothetical protein